MGLKGKLEVVEVIMNKEFIVDDDGMITEYVGPGGDIVIPEDVTDIFFEAFFGSALITSVIIPGSIVDITPFVFERSEKLKVVKLCEGVSVINVCAFNDCKNLERIYLPRSLKLIKMNAISNCPSLKNIFYNGSKEDWDLIIKEDNWNENSSNYKLTLNPNVNQSDL